MDDDLRKLAALVGFAEAPCPGCRPACPNCGGTGRLWVGHDVSLSDDGLFRFLRGVPWGATPDYETKIQRTPPVERQALVRALVRCGLASTPEQVAEQLLIGVVEAARILQRLSRDGLIAAAGVAAAIAARVA